MFIIWKENDSFDFPCSYIKFANCTKSSVLGVGLFLFDLANIAKRRVRPYVCIIV